MTPRRLLLFIGALAGLGVLSITVLLVVGLHFLRSSPSTRAWSEEAVPLSELPARFGVSLPHPPRLYRSHTERGIDEAWEALALLAPGDDETFLRHNGLTRGRQVKPDSRALEVLQAFASAPGTFRVWEVPLSGSGDGFDGGTLSPLHREALLFEGTDGTWLWLSAFETW